MKIRTQMALWYFVILLAGFLLVGGWGYYEMAVAHPAVARSLAAEGHTVMDELGEIMLFGGLPALILALVGGWFLMQRAFSPITTLTRAVEQVHADNLGQKLPSFGRGDELDRLNEVFNSMMKRLDNSFAHVREFTLHASHELKTPLTILRGEIETRLHDPETSAADRELFAWQLDEIARLAKIVDALTLLTRADAGQLTLANEPVRLDELVRDSFADAQLLAHNEGLRVEMPDCDQALVRGDRHRLRQVLLNLTDNAIKYNQPGGHIVIHLKRRNGSAELSVSNTGPGIPPEKLARVFERFYRGDTAHSNVVDGCGLGLSIVDGIVKAHGGKIRLESEAARFTTVNVTLPTMA